MHCPNCHGKDLGALGSDLYYCWTCFIEIKQKGDSLVLNQVEEDGSLTGLNDLFTAEELTLRKKDRAG